MSTAASSARSMSTDVSWVVRVTPNQPVSCDSASPCIRVFESTGSIEPFPTTGSQDHPASYGTAFHQNGSYQITATKGLDTTIGYLSIKNKTLSPKRIETYCYPPGFSWPRYALNEAEEVTWTIAHAPQLSCGKATEGWTTASYTVTYK